MRRCKKVVLQALALVGAVMVLTACRSGYTVKPGDYILHIRNDRELQQEYRGKERVYGFAHPGKVPCEIWVRTDRVETSTLAHELNHCVAPNWHK